MPEILLHICCAPCGGGCVERLLGEGRTPLLYYSNGNLASPEEFERMASPLNDIERKNSELMLDIEKARGSKYLN